MASVYASIDLGGTNIKAALADEHGSILCSRSIPTQSYEGPQAVLRRIAQLVNDLATQINQKPLALGMAIPGLVDVQAGLTKFLPNLPTQWRDIPVRDLLAPQVNCPVYLLNDVRTATLGELVFGHGKTYKTFAFYALGTGIGGGVVIDGKLRLGPLGAAGELGHHIVLPDGPRCGCGARGCLETLASGPAITAEGVRLLLSGLAPQLHELVAGDPAKITPKQMALAAAAGDANIRDAIVHAARYLAFGIVNTVVTLHPDAIILGGGVAQIGDLLFSTLRQTLHDSVGMFPTDSIAILPSMLNDSAGTLGGIALALTPPPTP